MKLPAFDHANQQWDRYKEFHVPHSGSFVQFATGELICVDNMHTRSGWGNSHSNRGWKGVLNVTTFQMNDFPDFLRSERKALWDPQTSSFVKRSWMPQATPMLFDHDHNRVIGLGWLDSRNPACKLIPSRFANRCTAYWPGDGRVPVGGAPVCYNKPREWSKEERAEARAKALVIRTQVRLGVAGERPRYMPGGRVAVKTLLSLPTADMSPEFKHQVAERGLTCGYALEKTQWLEVRDV